MAVDKFYPPVSAIMGLEDLPEQLSFLEDSLSTIFDRLYYRDLQTTQGRLGDSAFYSLTLITYKRLAFEIPGTGIFLVLNPPENETAPGVTEIPVQLHYEWKVLRFLRDFKLESFPYDPPGFFNLLTQMIDIAPEQIVAEAINQFVGEEDLNTFVDDLNAEYGLGLTYPGSGDFITDVRTVMNQVETITNLPTVALVFPMYLADPSSDDSTFERINKLFASMLGGQSAIDFAKDMLIPKIDGSFGIGVGLEFPRSILTPLDDTVGPTYGDPLPEPHKTILTFDVGDFTFNTEKGIGFDEELTVDLPFCGIGNTGLTLEIDTAKLDISRTENIPEATADGRPDDFVGVYIREARIGLPQFWLPKPDDGSNPDYAEIIGRNLIIGSGGLSGVIALEAKHDGASAPLLETNLGSSNGFSIGLTSFDLTFKQNSITGAGIHGFLTIPGFEDKDNPGQPAKIDVDIVIGNDTFEVTASTDQGLTLRIPDILDITVFSLTVGRKNDKFYIAASGELLLTANAPGSADPLLPAKVDIKKILIYEDGTFEFEGGVSILFDSKSLKLGPVELTITAIHFGSHEQFHGGQMRKYVFFGFDGGVSVDPGGVDARGDGIKFYFTVDNDAGAGRPFHSFLRIEGIGIDIVIPGNATKEAAAAFFSGYLSMKDASAPDSPATTEYMGSVAFGLPKIGLAGSAAMRLNPKIPAFIVDLGIELPVPILLGATGLGIYGFRGLIGQAYVPTKSAAGVSEDDPWWAYYKAKVAPTNREGINIGKFEQKDGFSIGAGVSLATAADSGKTFSSKIFFLLGLPDVFLLQGQAAILKERIGLDTTEDPPFFALLAISSNSVEAALGVRYNITDPDGKIMELDGVMEMGFFFNDPSAWYINVGRDQPEEKRIQAKLLTLFNAYAYLMISGSGIKAGAGASWEFNKKFGPVKVELGAYLDTGGFISFKPVQIGGFISLGGYARVKVFGFGFGFEVTASLAAEAPQPFIVTGKFTLKINLPWPFKDKKVSVSLTWTFNNTLNLEEVKFLDTAEMDVKAPASAVNLMSAESYMLNYTDLRSVDAIPGPTSSSWEADFDEYIVPVDSRIDIEFSKPVKPGGHRMEGIVQGYEYWEYVAPQKAKSEQVKHEFSVESVRIAYWDNADGDWRDFNVYEANTPLEDIAVVDPAVLNSAAFGYWQLGETPNKFTKLSIMALSPFSYITQGTPENVVPEQLGYPDTVLLCAEEQIAPVCQNWEGEHSDIDIPPHVWFQDRRLLYRVNSDDPIILPVGNPFGLEYGVRIGDGESMEVYFAEPLAEVEFKITTFADCVKIVYYRRERQKATRENELPTYAYQELKTVFYSPAELNEPIKYESPDTPFHKILIEPCPCKQQSSQSYRPVKELLKWAEKEIGRYKECCLFLSKIEPVLEQLCKKSSESDVVSVPDTLHLAVRKKFEVLLATHPCEALAQVRELQLHYCGILEELDNLIEFYSTYVPGQTGSTDPSGGDIGDTNPVGKTQGDQTDPRPENPFECATFVHEICWMDTDTYTYNHTIPGQAAVTGQNEAMVAGFNNSVQPIWRPNTRFAIQVETLDKLLVDGATEQEYRNFVNFGFRTAGGIGHFHQYRTLSGGTQKYRDDYLDLQAEDREDEFKLTGLKHYVDYDRSYPNADGNLVNAKPLFYDNPRLLLFYRQTYVYQMLNNWDAYNGLPALSASLELQIKDPVDPPDGSGDLSALAAKWLINPHAQRSEEVIIIDNLIINGANCSGVIGPIERPGMNSCIEPTGLQPEKLYQAIYTAHFEGDENEVLKYNFQTSRYANFKEQIESYILSAEPDNESEAVFEIDLDVAAADLTIAQDVVGDISSAAHETLRNQYQDRFDRLLTGALKMQALNPPVTTEFNIVSDVNTGSILGVLVRSPEPLNDPKMPESVLPDTLLVSLEGDDDFELIFSKDGSMAFITKSDMNVATGEMLLTFSYLEYNGDTYAIHDISIDQAVVTLIIN